jgi:hypothetical protein
MLLRELSRWHPTQAAVWPDFVVVPAPLSDARSGLRQGLKPLLVQTLVTKLPIEALGIPVLHGASWLDQDLPHAMCSGPSHKGATCELRAVVCSHCQRVAPEDCSLIQQTSHVLA